MANKTPDPKAEAKAHEKQAETKAHENKQANRADQMIDTQLRKQEAATPPTEVKVKIEKDDPLGRQPGNPDDKIELPPEVPPRNPSMAVADAPVSSDDLVRKMVEDGVQTEARATADAGGAARPISERTRMEMEVGATRVAEASVNPSAADQQAVADLLTPEHEDRVARSAKVNAAFAPKEEPKPVTPRVTQQTLDELQTGRAVVEAREREHEHARELTARANADRLKDKRASVDDLSYAAPRKE